MNKLTSEQREVLARRLGYTGPMNKFTEFLVSSPQKRGMASGGMVISTGTGSNNAGATHSTADGTIWEWDGKQFIQKSGPTNTTTGTTSPPATSTNTTTTQGSTTPLNTAPYMNPEATPVAEVPAIQTTPQTVKNNELIKASSGQLTGPTPTVNATTATASTATGAPAGVAVEGQATTAGTPTDIQTATYDAALTTPSVQGVVDQFQHATGTVAPESTVRGQMASLMSDFEEGTPAWAAGALRESTAQMNARGLGASSMAGAASTQAAMEAALPIAAADANANLQMAFANLSNEQQKLMMANEARVQALFTDIAAQNAARQFNAASENQTSQFNTNLKAQVDQFNSAQINAMTQFNASERNNMSRFNISEQNEIAKFNAQLETGVRQFNAAQRNAMSQFVTEMQNQRQMFNANNRLIIDQSNAEWRRMVSTNNNANINENNRIAAQMQMNANMAEMNNLFQERRDAMNYAYGNAESEKDRALSLLLAQMESDEVAKQRKSNSSDAMWQKLGAFTAELIR
jgi:hypothetical protein